MNFNNTLQRIQKRLNYHTPNRLRLPGYIPAAVVIPLLNITNKVHILFTLRSHHVGHHKGQISFPGGSRETQDASLQETGIRETCEEIGIPVKLIKIMGQLDDLPTVSNFVITPFVATLPYPYPHSINAIEVAKILEVPLDLFLTNQFFEIRHQEHQGKKYPVYYYHFRDNIIWGATAFIFNRFIELVFNYNPARHGDSCS